MADEIVTMTIRIPKGLVEEIDGRIALVNDRKQRDGEKQISRNDWYVNMSKWVVHELPHQAVRADLIAAWPNLPEEALGVEK